jgi:hypothetical protein
MRPGARTLVLPVLFFLLTAAVLAVVAGCSNPVQQAIQKASGESGVTINVNPGSGAVAFGGGKGKTQIQTGGTASIPEGFPNIALPEGSKPVSVVSSGPATALSSLVAFSCPLTMQQIHDQFIQALPAAGFAIKNNLEFPGGDGLDQFSITSESDKMSVVVMGGGSDRSGGGPAFTIQTVPK